jgi:hypothetical protein
LKEGDTEIRDIEGHIIQDMTVVEFYYDNNLNIGEKFKWVPAQGFWVKNPKVYDKSKLGNY